MKVIDVSYQHNNSKKISLLNKFQIPRITKFRILFYINNGNSFYLGIASGASNR